MLSQLSYSAEYSAKVGLEPTTVCLSFFFLFWIAVCVLFFIKKLFLEISNWISFSFRHTNNFLYLYLYYIYIIIYIFIKIKERFFNWRRTQDSNLQALSDQLFSRQPPHHPDMRHLTNKPFIKIRLLQLLFFATPYYIRPLNSNLLDSNLHWENFGALVLKLKSPNILFCRTSIVLLPAD